MPIWLTLTSNAFAVELFDTALKPIGIGDEQIVAHDLHLVAQLCGERAPTVPVFFGQWVLKRDDRVGRDQFCVVRGEVVSRLFRPLELIHAIGIELRGGGVDGQRDVGTQLVAGLLNRLGDEVKRGPVAGQIWREARLRRRAQSRASWL